MIPIPAPPLYSQIEASPITGLLDEVRFSFTPINFDIGNSLFSSESTAEPENKHVSFCTPTPLWSKQEEDRLLNMAELFGTNWIHIEHYFPHRSTSDIRNHCSTLISKRNKVKRNRRRNRSKKIVQKVLTIGPYWEEIQRSFPDISKEQLRKKWYDFIRYSNNRSNENCFESVFSIARCIKIGNDTDKFQSKYFSDIKLFRSAIGQLSCIFKSEFTPYFFTQDIAPKIAENQGIRYNMFSRRKTGFNCIWWALSDHLGYDELKSLQEIIDNFYIQSDRSVDIININHIISTYNNFNPQHRVTLNMDYFSPLNRNWKCESRQTFGDGEIQCYIGLCDIQDRRGEHIRYFVYTNEHVAGRL